MLTPAKTVSFLGYAGLIPFVLLAALMWLVEIGLSGFVAVALAAYGALIASFLGGVHWGIAFVRLARGEAVKNSAVVWGVGVPLLAWGALLMPPASGLPLLALVLGACYAFDAKTYPALGLECWLPMRLRLTLVAVASCLVGAAAA
jgi:Protein of unknown function (DUF3429)